MHVLVMGVSGSGKSTVAALLAEKLEQPLLDADDLHPPGNIAKLSAGVPLTDDDRVPWLRAIHETWAARGGILACSALKQSYRDLLVAGIASPVVIWLRGSRELIAGRLRERCGHFAAPSILDGQLEELEPPDDAITVDIGPSAAEISDALLPLLRAG